MSEPFINDPKECVDEFIEGLLSVNTGLFRLPGHRVILRKDLENISGKIALLSGGGSGHEPAHAGYVGPGMLTGAICGDVFASPPSSSILAAIEAVKLFHPKGIILIIKNYTGDRLNFGLAKEWAQSGETPVEMVVIGEDCALQSVDRSAGRRGLAGTIFMHKIGGALSDQKSNMEDILRALHIAAANMGTIGVCFKPCILPGSASSSFELKKDEIEIGLGIHGEAGVKRTKIISGTQTVRSMLAHMFNKESSTHLDIAENEDVALLINNLGGTSNLEMGVITKNTLHELKNRSLNVKRIYSGTYITSLQMVGASITVMKLAPFEKQQIPILDILDAETTVAHPLTSFRSVYDHSPKMVESKHILETVATLKGPSFTKNGQLLIKECLQASCQCLIDIEDKLNEYDRGAGDGDCGTIHVKGTRAILRVTETRLFSTVPECFQCISMCCQEMGGTSGGIYSVLFMAMSIQMSKSDEFSIQSFAESLREGTSAVKRYGGAARGDRTIIDVLEPLYLHLLSAEGENIKKTLLEAAKISEDAALNTTTMKAYAGRASYVNPDRLQHPDPGAYAVATIVKCVASFLNKGII